MKTSPRHIFDMLLWPIIRLLWEPFSLKRSHWWQWNDFPGTIESYQKVPGDTTRQSNRSGFWSNLINTNFSWNKVALLEPEHDTGLYQIGFITQVADPVTGRREGKKICSIIVSGTCGVLVGPGDMLFFAIAYLSKKSVTLRLLGESTKSQLPRNIPIL